MKKHLKRALMALAVLPCTFPLLAITAFATSTDGNTYLDQMGEKAFQVYLFFRNISLFFVILCIASYGLKLLFNKDAEKIKKKVVMMFTAEVIIMLLPTAVGWAKGLTLPNAWTPPDVGQFVEPDINYNVGSNGSGTQIGNAFFDESISFDVKYVNTDGLMPYALATPSTATSDDSLPLIVWLHGRDERYIGSSSFLKRGLPKVLADWEKTDLMGFNAYVLCPQITKQWNTGDWMQETAKNSLQDLLDWFISEYNIDTNNIIICGHSMGGQGALYMAYHLPQYFSKLAVLSGYSPGVDISKIKIPTKGYVGTAPGEDSVSISYMDSYFEPVFGSVNTITLISTHGDLPKKAFNLDDDGDKCADLIEWMFS